LDVEEWRRPQRPRLRPDVVEQQHPPTHPGDRLAEAPTRPPVEEGVGAGGATQRRPDPVGEVEVTRRGAARGRAAQVYIPPNWPHSLASVLVMPTTPALPAA